MMALRYLAAAQHEMYVIAYDLKGDDLHILTTYHSPPSSWRA